MVEGDFLADAWSLVNPGTLTLEALIAAESARGHRLAWRLCGGQEADAEEVLQEAFLRAGKGLSGFRAEASLSTWFTRILIRTAEDHRRRRVRWERWRRLGALWGTEVAAVEADVPLSRRIGRALAQLSDRQRQCIVLVHMEGRTARETAAVLEINEGTVKTHVHRGVARLRESLADLEEA